MDYKCDISSFDESDLLGYHFLKMAKTHKSLKRPHILGFYYNEISEEFRRASYEATVEFFEEHIAQCERCSRYLGSGDFRQSVDEEKLLQGIDDGAKEKDLPMFRPKDADL